MSRIEVPTEALRLILARYLAGDTSADRDSDNAAQALGVALLRHDFGTSDQCDCLITQEATDG